MFRTHAPPARSRERCASRRLFSDAAIRELPAGQQLPLWRADVQRGAEHAAGAVEFPWIRLAHALAGRGAIRRHRASAAGCRGWRLALPGGAKVHANGDGAFHHALRDERRRFADALQHGSASVVSSPWRVAGPVPRGRTMASDPGRRGCGAGVPAAGARFQRPASCSAPWAQRML